jgi:hypothetical protein
MNFEAGVPVWTTGKFTSTSAENDLGLELLGGSLLRRLLPGLIEDTPQAGYYAFYSYLIAKWEELTDSVDKAEFALFFRRQELAYAIACRLHTHRHSFAGVQGGFGADSAIRESEQVIDLGTRSQDYIGATLGGYDLFYARVLEALRLTKPGAHRIVDRVTDRGRTLADAFARSFEGSGYYRDFFKAPVVPIEALRDLGDHVCLCTIPGRADHQALLDTFLGAPEEEPAWESLRQRRVRSFALHLTYHRDRPDSQPGDVNAFRATVASRQFSDRSMFEVPFAELQSAWRAYQLRECQTLTLTSLWSWYLQLLQETYPISHGDLRAKLVAATNWPSIQLSESTALAEARTSAAELLADGRAIVEAIQPFEHTSDEHLGDWLARALVALLAIDREASVAEPGLAELRDDGGKERWSLAHMHDWLARHNDGTVAETLAELIDELRLQHLRIATPKLSPTDNRDPFCFAEDNGLLRFIRSDQPFWTGARFGLMNTMLWSLGLIDAPNVREETENRQRQG